MKPFYILTLGLGLSLLTGLPASAQQKEGLGEYDQIIIKRKGGKGEKGDKGEKGEKGSKGTKDVKLTIVIKDDKVEVNGKSLDAFENEFVDILKRDIVIRDGSTMRIAAVPRQPRSPFHDGGGAQSLNGQGQLLEFSSTNKAFLGVSTKTDKGAKIINVTRGTAAEKAGLKKDDVITKINDIKIESSDDLTKAIGKCKPDEKVQVSYLRDGKSAVASASLGKRNQTYTFNSREPLILPFNEDGLRLEGFGDIDYNFNWSGGQPKLGIKAQDTDDGKGVKVLEVDEESAAEKAGIEEGDIITSFDGKPINSVNELVDGNRLAREAKKITLPIEYLRNGKSEKVELRMPRKLRTAEL